MKVGQGQTNSDDFRLRVRRLKNDDCESSMDTTCEIAVDRSIRGKTTHFFDRDWYPVSSRKASGIALIAW